MLQLVVRMKKNKKAISPIVATLLLIAIAVASAAIFYFFVQDIIAARGKGDITEHPQQGA